MAKLIENKEVFKEKKKQLRELFDDMDRYLQCHDYLVRLYNKFETNPTLKLFLDVATRRMYSDPSAIRPDNVGENFPKLYCMRRAINLMAGYIESADKKYEERITKQDKDIEVLVNALTAIIKRESDWGSSKPLTDCKKCAENALTIVGRDWWNHKEDNNQPVKNYVEVKCFNVFEYIHEYSKNIRFALCTECYECDSGLQILSLVNDYVPVTEDGKLDDDTLSHIHMQMNEPPYGPTDNSHVVYLPYSELVKYGRFELCVDNNICKYPMLYTIVDFKK